MFARVAGAESGIIPANTGRILTIIVATTDAGDHPREYGENGGV